MRARWVNSTPAEVGQFQTGVDKRSFSVAYKSIFSLVSVGQHESPGPLARQAKTPEGGMPHHSKENAPLGALLLPRLSLQVLLRQLLQSLYATAGIPLSRLFS
jgi:hypothetical protein